MKVPWWRRGLNFLLALFGVLGAMIFGISLLVAIFGNSDFPPAASVLSGVFFVGSLCAIFYARHKSKKWERSEPTSCDGSKKRKGKKARLLIAATDVLGNEPVQYVVMGVFEREILGADHIRDGILIATDNRMVFYAKKLFGHESESFPFKRISSIENGKELMGAYIQFHSSGNDVKVKWINDPEYQGFLTFVNQRMSES